MAPDVMKQVVVVSWKRQKGQGISLSTLSPGGVSGHAGEIHLPLSQCHVTLNPLNQALRCWRGPQKAIPEALGSITAILSVSL